MSEERTLNYSFVKIKGNNVLTVETAKGVKDLLFGVENDLLNHISLVKTDMKNLKSFTTKLENDSVELTEEMRSLNVVTKNLEEDLSQRLDAATQRLVDLGENQEKICELVTLLSTTLKHQVGSIRSELHDLRLTLDDFYHKSQFLHGGDS